MAEEQDGQSAWDRDDDDILDDAGEESTSTVDDQDDGDGDDQQSAQGDENQQQSADTDTGASGSGEGGDGQQQQSESPAQQSAGDDAAQPAEQEAEERLRKKEEAARQKELDRILEQQRQQQSQQGGDTAPPPAPSELVANVLNQFGDIEISDPESSTGKSKLSAWADKYPGILEAAALFSGVLSRQAATEAITPIQGNLSKYEAQQQANAILTELQSKHQIQDAPTLLRAPEFWDFVDTLSPRLQQLADSSDAEDIAVVVKMYREKTGGGASVGAGAGDPNAAAIAAAKAKNQAEAQRQKNLHKSSLTSRPASADRGSLSAEEQKKEAWAKDDDDADDDL